MTEKFYMTIEDVFQIKGRGTVINGKISSGKIRIGDIVCLCDTTGQIVNDNIEVKSLEIGFCHPRPTEAEQGMNLLLGFIETDSVQMI